MSRVAPSKRVALVVLFALLSCVCSVHAFPTTGWNKGTHSAAVASAARLGGQRALESSSWGRFLLSSNSNRRCTDNKRLPSVSSLPSSRTTSTRLFSLGGKVGGLISRQSVLTAIGGTIVALPLLAEAYARAGSFTSDFSKDLLGQQHQQQQSPLDWDAVEHITLVFHGAGGQDAYTAELMNNLNSRNATSYKNVIVDWSELSGNLLQASFNGQRLGKEAASQLEQILDKQQQQESSSPSSSPSSSLKSMHIIGISVGAFCADAAVTALKKINPNRYQNIQLTLLDPFTQRGAVGFNYGKRQFGKSADYTQQYLNTDDPVPSTNTAVDRAVTYDVTNLRPTEIFGHDWPLVWYARSNQVGVIVPKEEQQAPGTVTML